MTRDEPQSTDAKRAKDWDHVFREIRAVETANMRYLRLAGPTLERFEREAKR